MSADTPPYKLLPYIQQNKPLLLLVALTLIRGLIYASVTIPWWQGHDEEYHFAQTRHLVDQWSASPSSQDQNWLQELVATFAVFPASRWTNFTEHQINLVNIDDRYTVPILDSLSYYLYAWPGQFLIHQDLLFQLFAMRLVSVLITCGTIIFAFLSARQIFTTSLMMQILVPWLIIFNPSFMFIDSTINNGILAVLFSTIIFYLLLLEIIRGCIGWRSLLALGLTILALQTKPTTYFLVFVWGLLLAGYAWKLGRKYRVWIGLVGGLFIVSLLLFLPEEFQAGLVPYLQFKVSAEAVAATLSFKYFWAVFSSFWVALGFEIYRLAQIWYIILLVFWLLAMAGLLLHGWRYFKKNGSLPKSLLLALSFVGFSSAALLGVAASIYDGGPQLTLARYLFPAIVPLSILMVAGWGELLPSRWQNVGFALLATFLFLFDTMVWFNYAIPWYYPFWPH